MAKMAWRPKALVCVLAAASAAALLPAGVSAWGMDVHRMITRRAVEQLPAPLKAFYMARVDFIAEHSVDPDLWRVPDLLGKLGNEDPNHFLDYDGFKDPYPFTNVPHEWDAVVQKYGAALANRNGRLPWRAEEMFDKLVGLFQDLKAGRGPVYIGDNIRYLSAVMAHYTEDAHQPFHAIENYDGQLTNQRGIHSRFENDLVMRNKDRIQLTPAVITPIPNIREYFFQELLANQAPAAKVLAADKQAVEGRELYDDGYYQAFAKDGAWAVAEERYNASVSAVVSVWVAAWDKAGKPEMPTDGPRTPARIRRLPNLIR